MEGLMEKTRKVARVRNRLASDVEEAILEYSFHQPTHGPSGNTPLSALPLSQRNRAFQNQGSPSSDEWFIREAESNDPGGVLFSGLQKEAVHDP